MITAWASDVYGYVNAQYTLLDTITVNARSKHHAELKLKESVYAEYPYWLSFTIETYQDLLERHEQELQEMAA